MENINCEEFVKEKQMKSKLRKFILSIFIVSITAFSLLGCAKTPYDGEWAYIHDDSVLALKIKGNSAELDGVKCDVTVDGDTLKLKAKDGKEYLVGPSDTSGQITLYKFTTYEYDGDGTPDGLVGFWKSKENWSFEFSDQGTFKEDGYFPGYYIEDKDNKTFSLIYNDHFVDTTCSYSIDGNELTVQYPWPMVQYQK